MYRIKYNDLIIFDPYDTNSQVFEAKLSQKINSAAYLDFTISKEHPLYDTVKERDGVVSLSWIEESGEQEKLFEGVIDSISINFYGHKEISCISALDYLNDTVVRPYSTIAGEQDLTAPSSIEGYFDWLIEQHNNHILDSKKRFSIGINQGAGFRISDYIYRSSTDNPTTASEISNKILESLGGYLILDYGETSNTLNLYSDIHEMNTQIIDFGVNLLDFTKKTDTDKQYTAVIPIGGSPKFVDGGFEDDNSFWLSPDNLSLSSDKVHSGNKSAYFVEGTGEFINKSFFYAKHNATYKSTIWIKNERTSNVKIYPSYQTSADDSWENKTPNDVEPMDIPNDDQWHEYSFTFSPNIVNGMKIRPRWVFDPVSNDNGARVYVDDFDFSRVIGDAAIEEDPISISTLGDGVTEFENDFVKHGDVIYSSSAVQRYGYKEKVFQDTTITDARVLMQEAVRQLNMCLEPTINIDVKAIDLSLYMNGYSHLKIGQAVRIRSAIHKTDLYLIVSSIDINLQDPAQTSYELGEAYDTLSGKQSSYLQSLNSSINSSLDAVASLDQTTKDQAIKIESVTEVANKAQETATSSSSKADNAQTAADNAQKTADTNKEQIGTIKDKQSEHDALIEQAKKDIAASENEISGINDRMTQMDSDIEKAQSDIESTRQEAQKNFDNVRDSVSKTQSDVDAVTKKASDLSDDLDATKATVSKTVTEFGEVKTTATNAASKADQSLQVSTQASQTATSASQTATSAYNDAQTAITKSSEAVQTANNVSLSLKTDYQTKADADAKYATQASLTATSDQIKTEVSQTYATKATVNALENIANNAVQTWMGTGAPTLENKPASDWNTAELKTQHSGDIYYDTNTGYSYRFGSSDGSTYSWALIKDTDISKAIADAANAQKTADSATSGVSELKSSIPVTYATKTELTQKADSITSRVEEVAQVGTTTSSKVTQLEQKTDEITSTVSEQGSKLNNAVTTISQVSQKADSISSTVQQVQGDLNSLDFGGTNLVTLGYYGFNSYVTNTSYNRDQDLYAFTVPANLPASGWGYGLQKRSWDKSGVYAGVPWSKCGILSFYMYADRACTINIDVNTYPMTASSGSGNDNDAISKRATSSYSIPANQWVQVWIRWENSNSTGNPTKDDMYDMSSIGVISSSNAVNVKIKRIKFEVGTKPTAWSPCPADVDANIGMAQGTANSALSKASTVEQSLDGFKTTVSQTYETKTDSLAKQSTLNQKVDSLRSEVSETYATKTQINNASSTTNMWPNQWFDTSKPCIGRAPVGDEIEAAPVGGNIRIIEYRDNYNPEVSSSLAPGRKYKVSVDAKKVSGNWPNLYGGIWYTVESSGYPWDGIGEFAKVKDYGNNWYRFERTVTVPDGKTMGTVFLQLGENSGSNNPAKWKISNLRFEDVTDIADIQANYSTKSYVDQTSRTVSLGVVEEYKNGQHGSALATQSDITVAKDSITSTVSQTYATQSLVQQTSQEWGVKLNQLSTATDNAIADVNKALDTQSDALTTTSDKIDDEITRRQAYMNFTQDDNGNPLLELGASQNTNKVDITNEKVSFQSEGSEVAYISNKELHINNATIVQKLVIGNRIGFIPRADGHLTLTRI